MQGTVVRVGSGRAEGLRKRLIALQSAGAETRIVGHHRVRGSVLIRPLNLSACRDCQCGRREREITDVCGHRLGGRSGGRVGRLDTTEQSVILYIARAWSSGREIQRRCVSSATAVAKAQTPEPANRNVGATGILKSSEKFATARIKRINCPIAEIPDQQSVAEIAEISRRQR